MGIGGGAVIPRRLALAGLALASSCAAQSADETLRRCLADFGGIEWRLPYRPRLHAHSCASPAASLNTGGHLPEGKRSLELIGELTLGTDSALPSDENYAAIQQAVFIHFDSLFLRQGYRRIAMEHGDARTRYHENTVRMLHGLPQLPEDTREESSPSPLPYVSAGRYVGQVSGREVTLIYQTEARNTWRITLDGLPGAPPAARAAR